MNYRIKSLLFIAVIFSYLTLFQNCGSGLEPNPIASSTNASKLSVDSNRLKVGDLNLEKNRITQPSVNQQQTTTTTNLISSSGSISTSNNSGYQSISYYQIKLWPNGELIYKFDPSLSNREKDLFSNACASWELETQGLLKCVALPSGASQNVGFLLVSFTNSTPDCTVDLGVASDISKMVLTEGCVNNTKVLHLLGHAFGLIDQHLRPDRDEFVKVPTSGGEASNFIQFRGLNLSSAAYDFASIMNHPFVGTYQPISGKVPQDVSINSVGVLTKISSGDKAFISQIYGGNNNGTPTTSDGSCSNAQLVTWGFGCYYHIQAYSPGRAVGTVLPPFNNQNTAFETGNQSSAQVKCVDGSWQLQTAQCANLPGVTTGTTNQGCAQTTLSWGGTGANSLCYLPDPQTLPQSSSIGSVFEVATKKNNYPVGFGIFVCERDASSGVVKWNFKSTYSYKNANERYAHTKNSFCYAKQDTIDQCPSGMGFSWKGITGTGSGNSCSGTLTSPITVGSKVAIISTGTSGWARVTCTKNIDGTYKIFSDTSENTEMGFCGHSNNNPAPINLADSDLIKSAKCLPTQKLISWQDKDVAQDTCSASISIPNEYFEGQGYIYQNTLEANSFNTMVTLKCVKDTSGAGQWEVAGTTDITAAAGFYPSPICKKACLPPTQLSWTNTANDYTCWGTPDPTKKLIENEVINLRATNFDATSDSTAEFRCSNNGMLNKTQNSANKCAH
jgi:hypothetical protein